VTRRSETPTTDRTTEFEPRPIHRPSVAEPPRVEAIPDEHRPSVKRGLADLQAGRIATDDEIEAAYRRFGR
jgi:predicted transcriptional regulator